MFIGYKMRDFIEAESTIERANAAMLVHIANPTMHPINV